MEIKPLFSGRAYYEITADDGQKYVYTPQEFVEKGFVQGKVQNYDPVFMDKKDEVLSKASSFTLPEGLSVNSAASKLYSEPSKGVIWKAEDFAPYSDSGKYYFTQYNISDKTPAITGLATVNGKAVYATNASKGYDSSYVSGSKANETYFTNITQGKSGGGGLFGGLLGSIANPVLETVGDALIKAGPALQLANFVAPGVGTALAAGTALGQGNVKGAILNAAIGEATGNSMFTEGGGTPIWETPKAAPTNQAPVVDAGGPVEILPGAKPATGVDAVLANAGAEEALSGIDLGGVGGSPNTWLGNGVYGAVPAAIAGTGTIPGGIGGAASGVTLSNVVDAIKGGVLVNAITGDPLGLSGDKGGGSAPASTGFAMVPIPAEWKSPTYAASSAPIDLESIFSDQNMLGGTQWQGLPTQRPNISFNDIFASGKQQTPMGSPVDMNQIMRSILGQTATSQKPA